MDGVPSLLALISGSAACILNFILLPLIYTRSPGHMGQYKYLLFFYTLMAFLYAVTQILTVPTFYVSERGLLFYAQMTILARLLGSITIFLFVFFHAQIVVALVLSFCYRLFVMTGSKTIDWFRHPCKIFILGFSVLLTGLYLVGTAIAALHPTSIADEIFKEPYYNLTGRNISDWAYIGAAVVNADKSYNKIMLLCMGSFAVFVAFSSTVIAICILGIVKMLNNSLSMVLAHQRHHHKKLFALLIFQTLIPFLFTFIPPFVGWTLSLLQISIGEAMGELGDLMTVAQVIDPILVFYFIADYRRALMQLIVCRKRIRNISSIADSRHIVSTFSHAVSTSHAQS